MLQLHVPETQMEDAVAKWGSKGGRQMGRDRRSLTSERGRTLVFPGACRRGLASCLTAALRSASSSSVPGLPQLHTWLLLLTSCRGWPEASPRATQLWESKSSSPDLSLSPLPRGLHPGSDPPSIQVFQVLDLPLTRDNPLLGTKGH